MGEEEEKVEVAKEVMRAQKEDLSKRSLLVFQELEKEGVRRGGGAPGGPGVS